MTWRKPADRALVQAVIGSFREDSERAFVQLSALPAQAWERSDYWLDASGMALYFLDLISQMSITSAIPGSTLERLRANLRKNKRRSDALFREFVALNRLFQARDVMYANHKGFTLCPHSCPLPELRHQLDLDFLVTPEYLAEARNCLEERGYRLAAATDKTWEFKAGDFVTRKRWDNYSMGTYRSVELHFGIHRPEGDRVTEDRRFRRLSAWIWGGGRFPALSPADQLIGQALHLFSHFRNENTRPSWLLEFRRHVLARHDDQAFWREITEVASADRYSSMAFAVSTLIASEMFGRFAPPAIEAWALGSLPHPIRLWAETYGLEAVLADFPGTKLYLLLETQLETMEHRRPTAMRKRLFPLRLIGPSFSQARAETTGDRLRRYILTLKFTLFRLRFHTTQALRVCFELPRWRRLIRSQSAHNTQLNTDVLEMTKRKQVHDNLHVTSR
jgi:hypothetical protein